MVYPATAALSALEPKRSSFLGDAWALPVSQRPRPEPTVIIPAKEHSDAYREHISGAALAMDALGLWRVWLTDAENCIGDSGHSPEDVRRLQRMNRNELAVVAELVAQRQPWPREERPLVVVLHYGWVKLAFGLGLHHYEQIPEPTRHVFVTVYETDGMTLGVRTLSRRMDQVWTTCYNNAVDAQETFSNDPGAAPLVLDVPEAMPVLPQRMSTGHRVSAEQRAALAALIGLPPDPSAVFVFMKRHNYDTGWDILLRAFVREFPPGPRSAQLVLKLGYQTEDLQRSQARINQVLAACADCPSKVPSNVIIVNRRLDDAQLGALYDLADAYVEPGHGSGCMSVTAMRMMMQARPVFGPTWGFCNRCRVPGSRDGSTGVFTVNCTAAIPAFTEVWQDFALLADQLDQDFVDIDEEDLRLQMRALASLGSFKRRGLGVAALTSALHLADRTLVGTALLARLEGLQALHVASGRSAPAPRLLHRWAPRVQTPEGAALPPSSPVEASWAPFVPSGSPRAPNVTAAAQEALVRSLALKVQAEFGRLDAKSVPGFRNRLLTALREKQWGEARAAAEFLYRSERSAESLLALAVIWDQTGQVEPALLWAEAAWELMRRPPPRGDRGTSTRSKESSEGTEMTELLMQLHCSVFLGLPPVAQYHDYVRNWPVRARDCPVKAVRGTARDRARAHAMTAESHIRGDAKFTNVGFAADFADALTRRSLADRYASAVQHYSIAVMLQPSDSQLWQSLAMAFTRQRLASKKEPNTDFLEQQMKLMEMALRASPAGTTAAASSALGVGSYAAAGGSRAAPAPDEGMAALEVTKCAGGLLDKRGEVCCVSECGECGGHHCDSRPGGGAGCCGGSIRRTCWSFIGPPPCLYRGQWAPKFDMCTDGILSSYDHTCCPKSCGKCGGPDCASRPGGPGQCCSGFVRATCTGAHGPPPCVYTEYHKEWAMPKVKDGVEPTEYQLPDLVSALRSSTASKLRSRPTHTVAPVKAPSRA